MKINFRSSSRKPPLESEFSRLLSMGNNKFGDYTEFDKDFWKCFEKCYI